MIYLSCMFTGHFKAVIVFMRLAMGWILFYAGLTHVMNATWTAKPLLLQATTLPNLFAWFALDNHIGLVNIGNSWGLLLIGGALILGLFTRFAAFLGMILMALYYLLLLHFPMIGEYSYIVDEHVIYFLTLALLAITRAGDYWGLDSKISL